MDLPFSPSHVRPSCVPLSQWGILEIVCLGQLRLARHEGSLQLPGRMKEQEESWVSYSFPQGKKLSVRFLNSNHSINSVYLAFRIFKVILSNIVGIIKVFNKNLYHEYEYEQEKYFTSLLFLV